MFERHCVAANSLGAVSPSTLTGCTRPSTMISFHWSKMVSFQSPLGMSVKVTSPFGSHLPKAKSAASGWPSAR